MNASVDLAKIKFNENGLVPAIAQNADSGEVLMLAWMSAETIELTLKTGEAHYFSRSRNEIWHKGATSGNVQVVKEIAIDCDGDTLLLQIHPAGPACHTGAESCFDTFRVRLSEND